MVPPGPYPKLNPEGGHPIGATFMTDDPYKVSLPSPFLLTLRFRFSNTVRWFCVEEEVEKDWSKPLWSFDSSKDDFNARFRFFTTMGQIRFTMCKILRAAWLKVPHPIRTLCYRMLYFIGSRAYPQNVIGDQQVPFGLCIRRRPLPPFLGRWGLGLDSRYESHSLDLLERHTAVPSPRLIEQMKCNGYTYLVMTGVSGESVKSVFHRLSFAERSQLANDLRLCVAEFRRIPNDNSQGYLICNPDGGPVFDDRLPGNSIGPFHSESEFNEL